MSNGPLPKDLKGSLSPRPYARLLTMIGDQLIKNEKIALFELIKNSYDADADWVQVRLINFDVEYSKEKGKENEILKLSSRKESTIEIEDNGNGMTWGVVSDAWMNPASPVKFLEKKSGKRKSPRKKRLLQGEKGIGRYAVYKIGSTVEIFTKSIEKGSHEIYLKGDLSPFDEEIFIKNDKVQYLDEIKYEYEVDKKPLKIVPGTILIQNIKHKKEEHGTIIRISNLKGGLNYQKINEITEDVNKLGSPFSQDDITTDFTFDILINGESYYKKDQFKNELLGVLERAPLKLINGKFDGNYTFKFELNGRQIVLNEDNLKEINAFQKRFCEKVGKEIKVTKKTHCGPFDFQFYVFDLSNDAPPKYFFDKNSTERDFVKAHRIYLYRDGIRVYPYGDPNDDWVGIDIQRGTRRAGDFLSNDQTIGNISISNEKNPDLKDKTNREGLLEIGDAYEDFIVLIRTLFGYLHGEYTKYRLSIENKEAVDNYKKSIVPNQLLLFREAISKSVDDDTKKEFDDILRKYNAERNYLIKKADTSEDLAAVGLTVEAASHDLMTMISRSKDTMDLLIKMSASDKVDVKKLNEHLERLRGEITFIEDQIKGIQPIFKSSRRRKKDHRIKDIINTAKRYYEILLDKYDIRFEIEEIGAPLVIKTNEAVLLQTFINLIDNAVYWLSIQGSNDKRIVIQIDGDNYQVLFADNGPGISLDDLPYIFEAFYSTKGEQGRGLGLYIARQLLERNDFSITYETHNKILSGANFLLDFSGEED